MKKWFNIWVVLCRMDETVIELNSNKHWSFTICTLNQILL